MSVDSDSSGFVEAEPEAGSRGASPPWGEAMVRVTLGSRIEYGCASSDWVIFFPLCHCEWWNGWREMDVTYQVPTCFLAGGGDYALRGEDYEDVGHFHLFPLFPLFSARLMVWVVIGE